jgi:hypothetical protein
LDDFGLFAIDLKNKKKNDEKSKTPPLIERRYKYITHTHTHTHQASKQASKKDSVSKKPLARKSNNERLSGKRPGIFRERKR